MFSTLIDDVGVTTGNVFDLSNTSNFNVRYDGYSTMAFNWNDIQDINGDGKGDLLMAADESDNNGSQTGSVWVVYSKLLEDLGETTGTTKNINSPSSNYSVRYDGVANSHLNESTRTVVADVNGNGENDMIFNSNFTDYNGGNSGSSWIIFDSLLQQYASSSTGNVQWFNNTDTWNIRFDGAAASDELTERFSPLVGDITGDGYGDLVLGTYIADNGYSNSGSAWVLFSTLIDDVGTSTGNVKALSTAGNFNIRYDGAAEGDNVGVHDAHRIGDVNADGHGDLLLGTYKSDNGASVTGSLWVMTSDTHQEMDDVTGLVRSLATSTDYSYRYDGGDAWDEIMYGGGLNVGDVNNDGYDDLLIGAKFDDNNGSSSGSTYIIFSTPPPEYSAGGYVKFEGHVEFE